MSLRDPGVDDTVDASLSPARAAADIDAMPVGNDRYVVGPLLGKGGMGEVLRATDAQLGRDVAIKRMRNRQAGSVDRFLREARIQGRLDHPAIVPVHEVAVDDEGRPYFVMKRLAGTTLADILATTEPHDKRLLRAFTDVCLAVEFAHTRGVIHRDLKPSNIMLGDFGEVYVLDWGVARVVDDDTVESLEVVPPTGATGATEAGAVLGTIGYMPPEQLRGLPVDRRADVYALGCILFEILAGEPLHEPGLLTAVFDEYDARPSVRAPQRDVPPELEALVVRATAAEPEKRPATARELGDRVQRYLDGDRDLALRRRLAREQLAAARHALLGDEDASEASLTTSSFARKPPTEDERRGAIQAAGRALALDPQSTEAAELVGRIMLEPPRELPKEVVDEIDAIEVANIRSQAKIVVYVYAAFLAFIPMMYWVGVTDPRYLVAAGVIGASNSLFAVALQRQAHPLTGPLRYVIIAANVLLLAVMSRMFTSYLVAPGLAAGTMLVMAMHARFGRVLVLAAVLSAGVLASLVGEIAGWWPSSVGALDGAVTLSSPAGAFNLVRLEAAHAVYVFALIFLVGLLVRALADAQQQARRSALVQAWHLRQLVPTVDPGR